LKSLIVSPYNLDPTLKFNDINEVLTKEVKEKIRLSHGVSVVSLKGFKNPTIRLIAYDLNAAQRVKQV